MQEPISHQFKSRANSATNSYAHVRFDEKRTKFYRDLILNDFGSGPAYSIYKQNYETRCSPNSKLEKSAERSKSPSQDNEVSFYSKANITPAPTDYTPRTEKVLRKEPGYAPQNA